MNLPPSKLDLDQYAKITSFKERLQEQGLYWSFTATEQFRSNLRAHLSKVLQKWTDKPSPKPTLSPSVTPSLTPEPTPLLEATSEEAVQPEDSHEESPEFLDLAADAEEAMDKVTSVAETLQVLVGDLGSKIRTRTEAINKMISTQDHTASNSKKAINLAANDLEQFSRSTDQELPILRQNLSSSLKAMGDAAFKGIETGISDQSEVTQLRENVNIFESTLKETLESMMSFRDSIDDLPSLTSKFNRARKGAIKTMDQLISELETGLSTAAEVEESLQGIM